MPYIRGLTVSMLLVWREGELQVNLILGNDMKCKDMTHQHILACNIKKLVSHNPWIKLWLITSRCVVQFATWTVEIQWDV